MTENNHATGPDESGADMPVSKQERFVLGVYASVDEAIADELERLRCEEGIVASCQMGCCHCCQHHILMDREEAHALAQFVKRELSSDQIDDLRHRTHQWHAWDHSRPGRGPLGKVHESVDISDYTRCCPLLVNRVCIAYPARPVVCRVHLVSSDPHLCYAVHQPTVTEEAPAVLKSVAAATAPFSAVIRDRIEDTGVDFSRSLMLLPHWLAIEMDWSFAISP